LADVQQNPEDKEKVFEFGKKIVSDSIADDIFSQISYAADDVESLGVLRESINELRAPLADFHRECLGGKKEFENKLPYVLESIAAGNVDFEMIYKAMEQDHNSFESFKKIYFALASAKKKDELEKFFNDKYKNFTKNQDSSDALRNFLLSRGDIRRIKQISQKASVDEMKRTALAWYDKSDYDKVIFCCKKLISRHAHLEFAYNTLGVVYRKLGKLKEAIEVYETGIEIEPNSVKLHHNVSIAYSLAGEKEKSRKAADRAHSLKGAKVDLPE
jgi:tetratricopeptide (TPR) repeat protein